MKKTFNQSLCTALLATCVLTTNATPVSARQQFGSKQNYPVFTTEKRANELTDHQAGTQLTPATKKKLRSQNKGKIKLQEIRPLANNDNARITLVVKDDWGDGGGYQVLLDADATIYQDYIENTPENDYTVYDEVEYSVPANASPSFGFAIKGETRSVDIPAGTYDYVVLNPSPSGLYITQTGDVAGDDYNFMSGYEYVFTITNNGSEDNCTMTSSQPTDLAITAITSPQHGYLTNEETVTVTIENRGLKDVSNFIASYRIDDGTPVSETVTDLIEPGKSLQYSFKTKADLSVGKMYKITASVECDGDNDAANNSISANINHIHAVPTPYYCGFDEDTDIGEWNIIDANDDGTTWVIDLSSGYALVEYSWDYYDTDDYLVTTNPIILKQGTNNIVVTYNGYDESYEERFEILYGTSSNVEEMTVLKQIPDFYGSYDKDYEVAVNFDVKEAGNYFFAIHGTSKADQYGLIIEDVTIDKGSYKGNPDLVAKRINLPLSNCSLGSDEKTSIEVGNAGTADAISFDIEWYLDDKLINTQNVSQVIAPQGSIIVENSMPVDLSATGKHVVKAQIVNVVQGENSNPEEKTDNNVAQQAVIHYTPTDVPFAVKFSNAQQREQWTGADSWSYNDFYSVMYCAGTTPLLSRGVNLKAGKTYRLQYSYMAGMYTYTQTIYENYDIIYGLDGEDPLSSFEELASYKNVYTNDTFAEDNKLFTVPADGIYQFGFVQNSPSGTMGISQISITEAFDNDISVNSIAGLPSMLPAGQFGKFNISAVVTNVGCNNATGKLNVLANGKAVATATFDELESYRSVTVPVEIDLSTVDVTSGSVGITVEAVIDGTDDDNPENNTTEVSITVSDDTIAYDHTTADKYDGNHAIGVGPGSATAGIAMRIASPVGLKAFSIGWGAADGQDITLGIDKWNPETAEIGDEIYSGTFSQGTEIGQTEYTVDEGISLPAGDYMVSVTFSGYSLASDHVLPGQLYMLTSDKEGNKVALNQTSEKLGTPAIRILVDNRGSVYAHEIADMSLTLYPNPAKGMLTIKSSGEAITNVAIYSAAGAEICNMPCHGTEFKFDTSSLAKGIYFAKVKTNSGNNVLKFIVK